MKHASPGALLELQPLLVGLRTLSALSERKPGIFYRRGAAFLHFHEDAGGLFADIKLSRREFTRCAVNTEEERVALLELVWRTIAS